MLKRIAILVAALLPPLVIVAMILGARSFWVPVTKDRYEDCFYAAKQTGNKHPDCRLYETIWERGFVDPTAYYTLWLTLFTGVLAAVGIAGTIFGLQQIKLARDEFNATHRPRIRVRYMSIPIGPDSGNEFDIVIANTGESDAIVISYQISVRIPDEPTPDIIVEMRPHPFKEFVLKSGERHLFPNKFFKWVPPDEMIFLGTIIYTDAARQITRMTGFARELDAGWSTYRISKKHSESEYED
jgi:hypothetical protein